MSMFRKILVPIDASECAALAARHALELGRDQDAAVHFVHVLDVPAMVASIPSAMETLNAEAEALLEKRSTESAERGDRISTALLSTDPKHPKIVDHILIEARSIGADLIVAGTHGRGPIEALFLGSVAEGLTRKSPLPLLLLRHAEA